jgi:hypothetical protein
MFAHLHTAAAAAAANATATALQGRTIDGDPETPTAAFINKGSMVLSMICLVVAFFKQNVDTKL